MDERNLARLIVVVVTALLGGSALLLLLSPLAAYEWLVRRRLSWWGVETKLADEAKFRRMARFIGLLLVVIMGFVLWVSRECWQTVNG